MVLCSPISSDFTAVAMNLMLCICLLASLEFCMAE